MVERNEMGKTAAEWDAAMREPYPSAQPVDAWLNDPVSLESGEPAQPAGNIPFANDQPKYVLASPPDQWLKVLRDLCGVHGPDAGVLWAITVACLCDAK